MTTYADVFAETMRLWRGPGGICAATRHAESELANTTTSAERGQVLSLLAGCYKRQEDWHGAERCLAEALELVVEQEQRMDVLCEVLDLCVFTHRVGDGMGYAFEMDSLLRAGFGQAFRGQYHHNVGRLLIVAGDDMAAVPHLRKAHQIFRTADKLDESLMVGVSLARALLRLGQTDDADALCREALLEATSPYVLIEAELVLERIAAASGDYVQAERHIDRATRLHAENVSKRDFRVMLDILLAEADLAEHRGDTVTARRLRTLVNQRAVAGRVNLSSEVTA